jgi:hypothetical protein
MTVGMGAVATTLIAGVEAVRKGLAKPIGSVTQMGPSASASAPTTAPRSSATSSPSPTRRHRLHRLGHLPRKHVRSRQPRRRPRPRPPGQHQALPRSHRAHARRLRPVLRQAPQPPRTSRPARASATSPSNSAPTSRSSNPRSIASGRHLVRLNRNLPRALRPATPPSSPSRKPSSTTTPPSPPPRSTPTPPQRRRPLRQRRAQPHRRPALHDRALPPDRRAHLRQGLQDRPDPDQDRPRPRLQGPHVGSSRLVLHQHPRQPRRRSPRRPRVLQDQGRIEARRAGLHPPARPKYPDLYGNIYHKVRINYYPPRGDNKEGWDNIDIFGWLGYPMQIKVDFLCRDSILAAPIALDLASSWTWPSARRNCATSASRSGSASSSRPPTPRRPLPRTRPLHPVDEAEEHAAPHHGRRPDHPPRPRILRLAKALEDRFRAAGLRVFDFKLEPKPSVARAGQDPRWGGYLASFKLAEREKFEHVNSELAALRRDSLVIGPNQQRAFTIDLSKYEYITGKLEVELDNYTIYVYSPAMIAIEKLRAICQQMPEYTMQRNPSARARDFYDIHLIISATGMDLTAPDKIELLRNIFAAKKVPLRLLGRIKDQREFHRPDWDSVRVSSKGENLGEFDTYFDSVVRLTHSMKTVWEE